MEKDYITFSSDFMYVEDEDGKKQEVPQYVSKAFKRYRYYKKEGILRKQCTDCQVWIDVMRFSDGLWIDIHKEEEIHLMRGISGFDVRCSSCRLKKEENRIKQEQEVEKNEKYSLYLRPSNKKYLEIASQLQSMNMSDLMNAIIEREKDKNPVDKLAKRFYENLQKK